MAFAADLKWRQHRRPCLRSRKQHRKILTLTSRLAGLALHVPFDSRWSHNTVVTSDDLLLVPVCIHSVLQSHVLAIQTRLLSGFAHVLLTTFDIWFHCGRDSRVHLLQIMSPYAWAIFKDFFRSWERSLDGMNGAIAFSRSGKKRFGVSAVKTSGSSFTAVRGLALSVCPTRHIVLLSTSSIRLRMSKIAIMTFLQLWTSLSQIPPKWGAPGGLNFQTIFFSAKSLSILALSLSFMKAFSSLAAPANLFCCCWWWYLGSHVLQWILSQQLDMTRCPMTVRLRCLLLSLSGK